MYGGVCVWLAAGKYIYTIKDYLVLVYDKHTTPYCLQQGNISTCQDKIFRRKRLSPGANFGLDYLEIWDKDILKFNEFSK